MPQTPIDLSQPVTDVDARARFALLAALLEPLVAETSGETRDGLLALQSIARQAAADPAPQSEPGAAGPYTVLLTSSDDPDRDAELIQFEDAAHDRAEIEAICQRNAVLALVYSGDELVALVDRAGKWEGLARVRIP
jgi:hypothetical protein